MRFSFCTKLLCWTATQFTIQQNVSLLMLSVMLTIADVHGFDLVKTEYSQMEDSLWV